MTGEYRDVRDAVALLCARYPDEYWAGCEADHRFPWEFYRAMAEAGRFRETLEAFPAELKRWRQYRIELIVRSLRGRLLAKRIELVLLDDADPA